MAHARVNDQVLLLLQGNFQNKGEVPLLFQGKDEVPQRISGVKMSINIVHNSQDID